MGVPRAVDFADIARLLQGQDGVVATLQSISELACATVEADLCGIMLVQRGNRVETAGVTSDLVQRADDLQLECGQGPCLEAIDDHTIFVIDDTTTETRWPQWCAAVVELGIRSVLSVRLYTTAGTLGSLNMYSARPHHFSPEDAQVGSIFGGHASVALAAAQTEAGLREAMHGRHLIGLAQGMLMERFSLEQEAAFAVLRRYSQDNNIKLRAVAERLVATRALP